jgi:hypothetical protein
VGDILHQRGLAFQRRGDKERAARDFEEARRVAIDCGDRYIERLCEHGLTTTV